MNRAYKKLLSFKKGGVSSIPDKKKQELLPFFAYLYLNKLDPEKYKSLTSPEEWTVVIQENKDIISKAAAQLTDEDWESLSLQYEESQKKNPAQIQLDKKGAKLKKLKQSSVKNANQEITNAISNPVITQGKEGLKIKKQKCSCGCDLILSKDKGGKLISTCACNCKGGKIKKK